MSAEVGAGMSELEFQQEMLKRMEWLAMMFVGPATFWSLYWLVRLLLLVWELAVGEGS